MMSGSRAHPPHPTPADTHTLMAKNTATVFPRADRYLLAITLIWGSTFAISKIILADVAPLLLQAVRFGIATLIVGIYARRDIRATTRASLRAGVILGLLLGSGFAMQTIGLVETTASKGGFLTGTLVVFTPILQMVIERRRPTVANYIGVGLVVVGLFILTSPEGGDFTRGDLLILTCAVVFAFHIVYLDVFTRKEFRTEIVFYQFAVSCAMGFVFNALFPGRPANWSAGVLGAILYLSVFATVIALFVQAKFQRKVVGAHIGDPGFHRDRRENL